MLKPILSIEGAQELSKSDQKSISGGSPKWPWPPICGETGGDITGDNQWYCEQVFGLYWHNNACWACR